MGPSAPDERGVTEFTGVAILLAVTVLVTASVGVAVLTIEEADGPPEADFSFQYLDTSSALLVRFESGEPMGAGNLTVQGGGAEATWAALANAPPDEEVGPGATVQLSSQNAYGQSISRDTRIRVLYTGGNETTTLSAWNE